MMSFKLQPSSLGMESNYPYLTNLCKTRKAALEAVQSPPILSFSIPKTEEKNKEKEVFYFVCLFFNTNDYRSTLAPNLAYSLYKTVFSTNSNKKNLQFISVDKLNSLQGSWLKI